MKKYFIIFMILFSSALYSQNYYNLISPVGWDNNTDFDAELESFKGIVDELCDVTDQLMTIAFNNEEYVIQQNSTVTSIIGKNNVMLPAGYLLPNNKIELDLTKKLVLLIFIDNKSPINNYRFFDKNSILFHSDKEQNVFSPYHILAFPKDTYSDLRSPTLLVNIQERIEITVGGIDVIDKSIENYNIGDLLGTSRGSNVVMIFNSPPFFKKEIFPIYIQKKIE
ncbi:MAG: hypothetical protein JEY91_14425 [Spirochaetaceae bacterium]|nr:hypothetical protein [Spirochaetaceae bacterium]